MAINDNEVSSLSFINKDFASIYPDVLDLAKKLTNKWDPSVSNESDPGVVLLKEAAFIADHNNYNIDKNILENFLPSATQDKSVRNICEMNGYTPRYYVSATGEVVIYWERPADEDSSSFTIPAFTLTVSNEDETVTYTQVEDIQIVSGKNDSIQSVGKFIEGTLQTLSINDTSTITLENLDDNFRVYLPEVRVAQNGIYVKNVNREDHDGFWERDNYLLTQPSGSYKYKVDFDSDMGLPYIEFPSDISNLIGDGLYIEYISTSGANGNVKATELTKILSPTEFVDSNGNTRQTSNFKVSNVRSFINGKDPETITEMYNSFRRIVGTFDTLITCLDYSNYVYGLEEDNGDNLVSNVYVTDRRTDYNKSAEVVTFDTDGSYFTTISTSGNSSIRFAGVYNSLDDITDFSRGYLFIVGGKMYVSMGQTKDTVKEMDTININDFELISESMTPYDLVVYALRMYEKSEYNKEYPSRALNNSYKPVTSDVRKSINSILDDTSCISHTFKDPSLVNEDNYLFRVHDPLKITLTPYTKIYDREIGESIIDNVKRAISENFNPRYLHFGKDINTADVKTVIMNCDSRIKDVDINLIAETDITSYVDTMLSDGATGTINYDDGKRTSKRDIVYLIAKNILGGRVCLFEFNDEFKIDYGQTKGQVIDPISKVSTSIPILIKEDTSSTQTGRTDTKTTTIHATSGYKYLLYAPNLNEGTIDLIDYTGLVNIKANSPGVLTASSYKRKRLQDKLTIYSPNPTGAGDIVSEYIADENKRITVTISDGELENNTNDEPTDIGSDMIITIKEDTIIYDTDDRFNNVDYVLRDNEHIQVIYPNYYSDKTYGMYVNYRYMADDSNAKIAAGTEHVLTGDERLVLNYKEEGVEKSDVYSAGTVINTSFDIKRTQDLNGSSVYKDWVDINGALHTGEKFKTLASNQTISTRKQLRTIVDNTNIRVYWLMNNDNNEVIFDSNGTKILEDGEYFIYSNHDLTSMVILGSGTRIIKDSTDSNNWSSMEKGVTIGAIVEDGLEASIPWRNMSFTNSPMYIDEMAVITLNSGDHLTISGWSATTEKENHKVGDKWVIDNDWQPCDADITYEINGDVTLLGKSTDFYFIRSRLDFMSTSTVPQLLLYDKDINGKDDEDRVNCQTITVTSSGNEIKIFSSNENGNVTVLSNQDVSMFGGNNIQVAKGLKLYKYVQDDTNVSPSVLMGSNGCDPTKDDKKNYPRYQFHLDNSLGNYIIPIYVSNCEVPVYIRSNEAELSDYFKNTEPDNTFIINQTGLTLLRVAPPEGTGSGLDTMIKVCWGDGENPFDGKTLSQEEIIIVGDINVVSSQMNSKITSNPNLTLEVVLDRIRDIIKYSDRPSTTPYLVYKPDNDMGIDLEKYCNKKVLSTGDVEYKSKAFDNQQIMFDVNNVANIMTLPYIDLDASDININTVLRGY